MTAEGPGNTARGTRAAPDVDPLVLTLYRSSFCAACARTRIALDDAAALLPGRVVLRDVDVARDPEESEQRAIVTTPTTVLTTGDGTELARAAGVPTTAHVVALVGRHLLA